MKRIAVVLGFLAACVAPASAWQGSNYTIIVPVQATKLPMTYYGSKITWTAQCSVYSQQNAPYYAIITEMAPIPISPDASGNFSGKVAVPVGNSPPNAPSIQSYSCALTPTLGRNSSGYYIPISNGQWWGYAPVASGTVSGNVNFP